MNHPKREEWVPYVFGEARADATRRLEDHLQSCAECRQQVEGWRRSLGQLDAWELPSAAGARWTLAPFLNWAAAAAVVVALGFSVGRFTATSAAAERVRQTIEPQIRSELRQEFAKMLREELDKSESQRLADLVALKKDLDTVAVMTDASLRRTQRQMVELADYAQPASFSRPPNQ